MSELPDIAIYGLGRAGQALAATLAAHRLPVVTLHTRDPQRAHEAALALGAPVASGAPPPTRAGLIFVCVRDQAVAEVARGLAAGACLPDAAVLCHLAGALPASVLDVTPRRTWYLGALHPMRALRGPQSTLAGSFCALDGEAPALALLERLCARLGCSHARVGAEGRALYHAAAALAGNDVVALLDAALRALRQVGLDEAPARLAAVDLARGALDHVQALGPARALTGALARGDADVIADHLRALGGLDADAQALHAAACRALLRLAEERGLDAGALARLRRVLDGGAGE